MIYNNFIDNTKTVRKKFKELLDSTVIRNYDNPIKNNDKIKEFCRQVQELKPDRLFRYRKFEENTVDALKKNLVVSNKAINFNDPFDSLVYVNPNDIEDDLMEPRNRIKLRRWVNLNPQLIEKTPKDKLEKFEQIFKMRPNKYRLYVMKSIGKIRKLMLCIIEEADMFLRNYPNIACFSESNDSPTMWAHYADDHKGFVLEYDFKNYNTPCVACKKPCLYRHYELLYPVIYCKNRFNAKDFFSAYGAQRMFINAPLEIFIPRDDDLAIYKILLHKSTDWEYEQEWRIISHCNNSLPNIIQKPVSIYLRAKMSPEDKDTLLNIAKELGITPYEMKIDMTNGEYKLHPKKINLNTKFRKNLIISR